MLALTIFHPEMTWPGSPFWSQSWQSLGLLEQPQALGTSCPSAFSCPRAPHKQLCRYLTPTPHVSSDASCGHHHLLLQNLHHLWTRKYKYNQGNEYHVYNLNTLGHQDGNLHISIINFWSLIKRKKKKKSININSNIPLNRFLIIKHV